MYRHQRTTDQGSIMSSQITTPVTKLCRAGTGRSFGNQSLSERSEMAKKIPNTFHYTRLRQGHGSSPNAFLAMHELRLRCHVHLTARKGFSPGRPTLETKCTRISTSSARSSPFFIGIVPQTILDLNNAAKQAVCCKFPATCRAALPLAQKCVAFS